MREAPAPSVLLSAPSRTPVYIPVAGIEDAQTLHSLLKLHGDDSGPKKKQPLEAGLLIVDETSMVDMWLAHQLFTRLTPGTKVLLVGDADQLESVGAGNPLSSPWSFKRLCKVCASSIPVVSAMRRLALPVGAANAIFLSGYSIRNASTTASKMVLLPVPGPPVIIDRSLY